MTTLQKLHISEGTLHPKQPFSFAQTLHFIEAFTPTMGEQRAGGGELTKAVMIDGKPLVFRVAEEEGGQNAALRYTLFSDEPLSLETRAAAIDRIRFYLSLDDDLGPFYRLAKDDPPFHEVVRKLYGFHQLKFLTPFENTCWAVLTQRMAIPAARSMKRRLVEQFGGSLQVEGHVYQAFPEAAQLARATVEELTALTGNSQKSSYLAAVAQAFSRVDEQWLRTGDYEQVVAWLRGIRGIGEWSAQFVLVRGLGRMEGAPATEKHMLQAASQVYGVPATDETGKQLAARYGTWQGYWMLYLRTEGQ